ncbi:helix-turn-helix domain protein [Burkholderia pseudomallei ABCPW 30]|uniref:helix-turn-helix domain-containing protein n=1 Tax=Burkholderia pseudomallei TaxID=28450 RepID=UPI0005369B0B|nr:helix-turn-helix domain-containing protein [Burkholderia pseudomallei]KGV91652.1 helix-turn-helix domain protein [Burkholderia pseudomallei ABCPW 30]
MQKHITPQDIQTFNDIIADWPENTASHQRARLLEAMRVCRGVTTLEAVRFLDIVDPRARVVELRKEGYRIDTSWVIQPSERGRLHSVGLYRIAEDATRTAANRRPKTPRDWSNRQLTLALLL